MPRHKGRLRYELRYKTMKFDTLGAEPVSWIIKKNKTNKRGRNLLCWRPQAIRKPLELISPERISGSHASFRCNCKQARSVRCGAAGLQPTKIEGASTRHLVMSISTLRQKRREKSPLSLKTEASPGEEKARF